MKLAVFPGSFDPITLGHIDIIRRSAELFDRVVVAIGTNAQKCYLYPLDTRKHFIEQAISGIDNAAVEVYEGLTVDFCRSIGAQFIVRGLRNPADFEYEKAIAQANERLSGIETVNLFSAPEHAFVSSTIVRDIIRNGGNLEGFVPDFVTRP